MKTIVLALVAACLLVPLAYAQTGTMDCTPLGVASFDNRVLVYCSQSPGGIFLFAVSTSDADRANRFLSLATTAFISHKQVSIYFDASDRSGEAFGCRATNCRIASGIWLRNPGGVALPR